MIRIGIFLAALVAAVILLWVAGSHSFGKLHEISPAERWPDGTTLATVPRQFPDIDENETATRFFATAARIDDTELRRRREAMIEYIRREVASDRASTDPPPEALREFLAANSAIVRTLRAQLASNPPPVWKQRSADVIDPPEPAFVVHLQLFTLFAADALAEHSRHNDTAAWSDLGAIWIVSRSLWTRPEITAVLFALTGSRFIAAVATKLSAPAPKWWEDYLQFDVRTPLIRALAFDAWFTRERARRYPAGEPDDDARFDKVMRRVMDPLMRPIQVMRADERAARIRDVARAVATSDPCASPPENRNWTGTIQRFNRFIIEREAAAKLLIIEEQRRRSGTWPARVDERSACGHTQWIYRRTADGMELSFPRHLPPPPTRIVVPLSYRR